MHVTMSASLQKTYFWWSTLKNLYFTSFTVVNVLNQYFYSNRAFLTQVFHTITKVSFFKLIFFLLFLYNPAWPADLPVADSLLPGLLPQSVSVGACTVSRSSEVSASWSEYGNGWLATEPLVVDMKSQQMSALDEPWEGEERRKRFRGLIGVRKPKWWLWNPEGIKNDGIKMQRVRRAERSPTHLEQDVVDSNSLFKGSQLLFFDERVVRD